MTHRVVVRHTVSKRTVCMLYDVFDASERIYGIREYLVFRLVVELDHTYNKQW